MSLDYLNISLYKYKHIITDHIHSSNISSYQFLSFLRTFAVPQLTLFRAVVQ